MSKQWNFNTESIHSAQTPDPVTRAISPSVVPAVAYSFESAEAAAAVVNGDEEESVFYGRYGNPTTRQLEKKIALLERSEDALGVSSGMAAISIALLAFLKQGDHLIVTKDVYGGTHKFLTNLAPRFGITYSFVCCNTPGAIEEAVQPNTKAIYIETPSNPSLTLVDIEAVGRIAAQFELPLIVDNTFMTPYLQRPLELGAHVVVHSATKYLNGHGDVIAGFICGDKEMIAHMRKNLMGDLGQPLNAWEAYLILRGLKTLGLRVEKHCANAMHIATFLEKCPEVEHVYYPGLMSHPQHELARKQMRGMGGIVSFEIKGGVEAGKQFINALQLAMISFSLGDPETLVQHPASMTHSSIPEGELANFGIPTGLIRLSLGLEDVEDIQYDIEQALETLVVRV